MLKDPYISIYWTSVQTTYTDFVININ